MPDQFEIMTTTGGNPVADNQNSLSVGPRGPLLMTPLMFAAMVGRRKVVEHLRERGASLNRRNRLGISARSLMCLTRPINLIFGRL